MVEIVRRPTFFEGQILAPADLSESLGYARSALARHERHLHTWGIGHALELSGEMQTTGFVVTVAAGLAIDPSGRQIVVPESQQLTEASFTALNGLPTTDGWYPVFLFGYDEETPPAAAFTGACDVGASSRVAEGFEITFGRLGEEADLEDQAPPEVGEGPAGAPGERKSRILLGFVFWDAGEKHLTQVSPRPGTTGPRYAGVAADEVVARGGVLTLRSRPPTTGGKPAVVVDESNGGELRFGLQDARGIIAKPVFTVNAKGDVSADGKLAGAVTSGLHVESGVATDGMLLPLPKDIKEELVTSGEATLHVHVTPRYDGLGAPLTPVVCLADGRRVRCRFTDGATETPGRCDYTVLAFVAGGEGGGTP
jgi:hypothetical protein